MGILTDLKGNNRDLLDNIQAAQGARVMVTRKTTPTPQSPGLQQRSGARAVNTAARIPSAASLSAGRRNSAERAAAI
ncbi:hypothetical protein AAFF_G00211960 [Aldrovandia affinis]|uniref:Uncharacterized protein n=1 Tax=Aldrovandia affinis TaxID=143900 RepID=A0AAD7RH34_9TELE|nr:hypothetical protein AAFF_G00211960 [Aldrovandia affinis]